MIESFTMKFYLPFILWIALLVNITHPFHVSRSGRGLLKKVATRLNIHAFDNEEALTQLLNSYDFRGAYDFVKKDPMLKISKDNAIKLLNNLQKLEPEPPSSSQADQSKKVDKRFLCSPSSICSSTIMFSGHRIMLIDL